LIRAPTAPFCDPPPERLQDREPDRARTIPERELTALLEGYGWRPLFVSGDEPGVVHEALAAALDESLDAIADVQHSARTEARHCDRSGR